MADETKEENLQDLRRQSDKASRSEPPFPKLANFTRGKCHAELQRAFELYDLSVEGQQKQRQVGGS